MPRSAPRNQPRKLPRQTRAQDTVEIILEATARVLIAEGYRGASTNRIAAVAGVSIGTLYQYFPSKESLLIQLSRRHSERMRQVFEQRVAGSRELPLRDAVRLIIAAELESLQLDLPLLRVLFEQVPRFGAADHIEQAQTYIVELFRVGLKEREAELRGLDLELVPFLLMHAVDGVFQAALRQRPDLVASDRLLDACTELVLRYLIPDSQPAPRPRKKLST